MMGLSDDPALQLLAAQRFVHEKVPKPPAVPLHTQMPPRQGRIRVGYLSGDLHMHAVGLLTPELFELHDRSRFEVYGFCWTPESQQPQRLRRQVKRCAMPNALAIWQPKPLPQVRRNGRPRKRNWPQLKYGCGARAKPMRR
jgi:predicted O-linked N-acetylglucosamine transferase (SPINDLY family)